MTALLLIGVLPSPASAVDCVVPHRFVPGVPWAGLALEISLDLPADEAARMLDWAGRQHQVLAQYTTAGDVLPVALGAVFSSQAALTAHVLAQAGVFDRAIASVSGCWEYILQVQAQTPTVAAPCVTGGTAFLAQRRHQRDERQKRGEDRARFIQHLRHKLDRCARAHHARAVKGKDMLADLSVLVAREAQGGLVRHLQGLSEQSTTLGLDLRLIGPTPAYSFLEGTEDG